MCRPVSIPVSESRSNTVRPERRYRVQGTAVGIDRQAARIDQSNGIAIGVEGVGERPLGSEPGRGLHRLPVERE